MFDGTPTGTSPERWNMCRCNRPLRTRTCTQPWHGAIVVRARLPAPRTWYCGIHGETKWVRISGSSLICSTRCRNWSNEPPSEVGKSWKAPPYDPGPMSPGGSPRLPVFSGVAHGIPPVAAERRQLRQRGRAVDERAQLADRLLPEGGDAPLGDHGEAVGQVVPHRLLHEGECRRPLPGRHLLALSEDPFEHVVVLAVRFALVYQQVLHPTTSAPPRAPRGQAAEPSWKVWPARWVAAGI